MSRLLLTTGIFLLCFRGFALDSDKDFRQFIVSRWDGANGLPQNRLLSIEQTPDGLIWANGLDGVVVVFDGGKWNRPPNALAERLTPGFLLPAGRNLMMLAGTHGELFEIRDRNNVRELIPAAPELNVRTAARTRDGRVWIATREKLLYWDGKQFRPAPIETPLGTILTMEPARNGDLWIGGANGLACLHNGKLEVADAPKMRITNLAEASDGTMLAVVDDTQLVEVRGNRMRPVSGFARVRAMARNPLIADVHVDRHGSIWLNLGSAGLGRITEGSVDVFTERDGVPTGRPGSQRDFRGYWIWEDREGGLWFGRHQAGILSLRDSPFETYGFTEGMPGEMVWTVLEDRTGAVWASTESGLFRGKEGVWTSISSQLKLPAARPGCLLEAKDGAVWACWNETLYRLSPARVLTSIPLGFRPRGVAEDAQGQIWVAGTRGGRLDWSNASKPVVHEITQLGDKSRRVMAASDGSVWFLCNPRGVFRLRDGRVEEYPIGPGTAESFHEDGQGAIWLGMASTGLYRIHKGQILNFRTRETGSDDVHAIVEDRRGYLWLSSNSGLRRVSRRQLEEVAQGSRERAWFQHFDEASGLRSREFQGGPAPAGFLARDGSVLFPSTAGVVRVDPAFDFDWQPRVEPMLDAVDVAGAPAVPNADGEVSLRASQNRVAFRFLAPTVSSPHTVSYQLAGFDKTWHTGREREPVTYTSLPPGRYHFLVRVAPFGGEPSEPKRLATINVKPSVLQSGWFLVLVALALASLGAHLANLRARSVRRRNERLEAEVMHRTAQLQLALRGEQELAAAAQARERDLELTRIRLEREIEQRAEVEQQLIHAQKMESVDRLAGGVAHDFNNLLTVIFANLELAKLSDSLDNEQAAHLHEIEHATRRAADLTRQLLTFARRQIVEPKVVDLNAITANMARILRRLIGEDVELVMIMAPDLGAVRVDPGQFEQILVNLVINARDAMPRGGKLTIETSAAGEAAVLSVADTGTGMDAQTMARVFEPFFTTKRATGGTGLGLAICYGIAQQAGGDIRVYSEPGKGARFEVTLPLAGCAPEDAPQDAAAPNARGDETILVAEDEERVRELVTQTLRAHGYRVTAAANGDEALRLLDANGWTPDLIIADVVMPLCGGRELADRAERKAPGIRVLYMSGYTEDACFHAHLAETGRDFLAKPFTLAVLAHKVREVLDRPAVKRLAARAGSSG